MGSKARVPSGIYKPCSGPEGCRGKGYIRGRGGVKLPHARCGGDGWIKVGRKRSGRGGKLADKLRKVRNRAAFGGGTCWVAGQMFGTFGVVLVLVVIALVVFLAAHRAVSSVRAQ